MIRKTRVHLGALAPERFDSASPRGDLIRAELVALAVVETVRGDLGPDGPRRVPVPAALASATAGGAA